GANCNSGGTRLAPCTMLQNQSFHSPCGRASYLSLLVQRKVTQRNHALGIALFGSCPKSARQLACVPLSARPCARKRNRRNPLRRRYAHRGRCRRNAKGTREQRAPARRSNSSVVQGWTD